MTTFVYAPPSNQQLLEAALQRFQLLTADDSSAGTPGMVVTEILELLNRAGETPESVLKVSAAELHNRARKLQTAVERQGSLARKSHYFVDVHEI